MVYLILDLDRTTFVGMCEGEKLEINSIRKQHEIDDCHELKEAEVGTLLNGTIRAHLFLLNPAELSKLIQLVSNQGGDVLILTAGFWDDSIREVLADHLDLSDKASDMLRQCHFHSPITDADFIKNASHEDIQYMLKSERLAHIIRHKPALSGKHFVVFDDDEDHIESLTGRHQTKTVLATPHLSTKHYYKEALQHVNDLSRAGRLTQTAPVLFQQGVKRAREEYKENTPNKCPRIDI